MGGEPKLAKSLEAERTAQYSASLAAANATLLPERNEGEVISRLPLARGQGPETVYEIPRRRCTAASVRPMRQTNGFDAKGAGSCQG